MSRRVPRVLFALTLALAATSARAALFPDEEARKSVDALTQRINQLEGRVNGLESTVKSQGLVDLLKDIEQIKSDIAALRGQQEVLTYELEQAQKRQRDLYIDLDGRLRKLETATSAPAGPAPAPDAGATPPAAANASLPGTAARGSPPASNSPSLPPAPTWQPGTRVPPSAVDLATEQRAYDTALDQFKNGSYPAAITGLQSFVRTYPRSPLAPSAVYWTGNAQYAQRDFRAAIATQRSLISTYPDSQKVPDALLNIASSQSELGDSAGARRTLEDLVSRYPTSEAAGKARQRLSAR
ncbi:MAG TPA: tol-pal system protein YbgF [Casimicrobiaceae bacterium]|nr:tol-pal system protein YbgF [Casimicrobiaceae bacterium]